MLLPACTWRPGHAHAAARRGALGVLRTMLAGGLLGRQALGELASGEHELMTLLTSSCQDEGRLVAAQCLGLLLERAGERVCELDGWGTLRATFCFCVSVHLRA